VFLEKILGKMVKFGKKGILQNLIGHQWEFLHLSNMMRNLFLFASLVFFACSDDSHSDLLDGTDYGVSEKEDCDGIEYNPKTQFCSSGVVKDKGEFTDERDGKKYSRHQML
jgi:hypothetical protein